MVGGHGFFCNWRQGPASVVEVMEAAPTACVLASVASPGTAVEPPWSPPRFTPEALTLQFTKGLLGWFLQVILIRVLLYTLGSGEAPLLNIVAYAGYRFVGTSLAMLIRVFWTPSYYFVLLWFTICAGVLLVKPMKRVLNSGCAMEL